jgi:hypothetical protein
VSISVTRNAESVVSGVLNDARTYYTGTADMGLDTQSEFIKFEGYNGEFIEVRNDGTIIAKNLTYIPRVAKTR